MADELDLVGDVNPRPVHHAGPRGRYLGAVGLRGSVAIAAIPRLVLGPLARGALDIASVERPVGRDRGG